MNRREYFDRTFMPHYRQMYALALSLLRNEEDAADAVQSCMLRLWEGADPASAPRSAAALCAVAVRRQCLTVIRDRRVTVEIDDALSSAMPATEASADTDTDAGRLRALMAELPDKERNAVELNALFGFDAAEIAERMETSAQNVRALLSRGRRKLRQWFSQ